MGSHATGCMCPVHGHSEYSALDGYGTTKEIAAQISRLGLPGAFLTDHGTVAGWKSFSAAMEKQGLFAGLGLEAYQAKTSRKVTPESYYEDVTDPESGRIKKVQRKPRDGAHLILLAENERGIRNIRTLSELGNQPEAFFYNPRIDWELLEKYSEGVIATSACLGGLVSQSIMNDDGTDALNRFLRIFGDRFYLELHAYSTDTQYEVNDALVSLGLERGLQFLPASDAHYCSVAEYELHETLLSMQQKTVAVQDKGNYAWRDDDRLDEGADGTRQHPPDLYIMDEARMRDALSYLPESVVDNAIENTTAIMERCQSAKLTKPTMHLPNYEPVVLPKGIKRSTTAKHPNKGLMLDLMERGLVSRYGDEDGELPDEVVERAEFEFKAIAEAFGPGERGLEDYFLITWDWVDWCDRHGILTGPGRGSAAGSILAYSLGITHVDPIKYDLYFERFWNPGRAKGLPDIDVDVPQASRDEVKHYLSRRWGVDHVRDIGTHIRMQPKMAIDRVMKVLESEPSAWKNGKPVAWKLADEHYKAATAIKKIIEQGEDAGKQPPWRNVYNDEGGLVAEGIHEQFGEELAPWLDQYEDVFLVAEKMTGRISGYGIHASAVIISDIPLTDTLPGRRVKDSETGEEKLVTQVEMKEVEKEGFLKADVLGLRNLDTLQAMLKLIPELEDENPNQFYKAIDLDNLDEGCYELLTEKLTLGLFQIENGHSARKIAKDMKPESIEDLAAIVALNRPGPLRSGMVDRYFARRAGDEPVVYQHEILEDILQPTYGDFLYQEQVLAYFRKIGYTLSEADDIRRMLGKKEVEKMSNEWPRYVSRATEFMTEAQAQTIWDEIIGFSKYSFNKSHAVAYAVVLAWTMWAKFHYPTEFIMASIATNIKKGMERIGAYISEGRRMGVSILPPDINRSHEHVAQIGDEILFGLRVKGVGEDAANWIIENRPYESYDHLVEKIEEATKAHKKIPENKRPAKSPRQICGATAHKALLNAGAFDHLHDDFIEVVKGERENSKGNMVKVDVFQPCTEEDRAAYEKDLLGVTITDIWADVVSDNEHELRDLATYVEAEEGDDQIYKVLGVVSTVTKRRNKKDASFMPDAQWAFVTIEWHGEELRFACFADKWEKLNHVLQPGYLGVFRVKSSPRGGKLEKAKRLFSAA